jgi:hypothetical protein
VVEQAERQDREPASHQGDAVEAGREMARKLKVEHTIHRRDGVITEKNSYGNDPYPPKDAR